ncbi:MAG TPA: NlpC/P60 family protein [Verrucomicrobiae bacterium]
MKAYYQDRTRQAALLALAQEWFGTPFVPHAQVAGVGVDCVQLAAALYQGTGLLREFKPGKYTMDGGQHNDGSRVTSWLEASPHFAKAEAPWQVGDLLCFRMGRSVHHVGVVLTDRTFVHVYQGYTVGESWIDDSTWRKRLTLVFRPVEITASGTASPVVVTLPATEPLRVPLQNTVNTPWERLVV